jgi:hypothetical protein
MQFTYAFPCCVGVQAASHASKKLQQCTVRASPTRGLLEAQHHKSQYAALNASNSK